MNKKTGAIILSIILAVAVILGGISYYLNRPYMLLARAFSEKNGRSITGTLDFKVNFDTSKIMSMPEFQDDIFASAEIAAFKSALDSTAIKVDFNGVTDGSKKLLLNGNATLPKILGESQNFELYADGNSVWSKSGDGTWVKAQNTGTSQDTMKVNKKNLLDFIKKCPVNVNGNTLTITINPTYEDIKNIIPVDTINKNLSDGLALKQIMDAVKITLNVTIDKNSKLFIPMPYVSKADITINGDMSKLIPPSSDIQESEKTIIEGISFTAEGNVKTPLRTGMSVEKPSDIK